MLRHGRRAGAEPRPPAPPRRGRRILLGLVLLVVLAVPCTLLYLAAAALDDGPVVVETERFDAANARRARALAKHTLLELLSDEPGPTSLTYTEAELNGMMAMVARGVPAFRGRVNVADFGVEAAVSYRVPANPFGRYFNVRIGIEPSSRGIYVNHFTVGSLEVPGRYALAALRQIGDAALGEGQGALFIDAVDSVELDAGRITVSVSPPHDMRARARSIRERFKVLRDEVALLGDPLVVRAYYERAVEVDRTLPAGADVSLAAYLGPMFQLARERSGEERSAEENRALILALVVFLGDERIERLVGKVRTPELLAYQRRPASVRLAGRRDLSLHFLISAGLKVISDRGISHAIGEFKELLDTGEGGTGFSFADLAADRAGVRFAEVATDASGTAWRLQWELGPGADESLFFPETQGLPEGLSEQVLEAEYGGTDGVGYAEMVRLIDARIEALPIFAR